MDPNTSPSQPAADSPEEKAKRTNRLDLSTAQVIGGALAASTAAAVGSRLGIAGTITGAALISIVSAVAGALYTHSINRTRTGVRQAVVVVKAKGVGRTPEEDGSASEETASPSGGADRPPVRRRLRVAAMAVGAAVIFGIALLAVTGFELATGRPLSDGGGGTSLSQLLDGRSDDGDPAGDQEPASAPETSSPTTSSVPPSSSSSPTSSSVPSPSSTTPSSSSATPSSSAAPSSSSTVPSSAAPSSAEPTTPVELPGDPVAE